MFHIRAAALAGWRSASLHDSRTVCVWFTKWTQKRDPFALSCHHMRGVLRVVVATHTHKTVSCALHGKVKENWPRQGTWRAAHSWWQQCGAARALTCPIQFRTAAQCSVSWYWLQKLGKSDALHCFRQIELSWLEWLHFFSLSLLCPPAGQYQLVSCFSGW